jgi:prevent-host-death family protein
MTRVSASDAKQNFDAMIEQAQRGPVLIQRQDRDVAVLISPEEFERSRKNRWDEFNRLSSVAAEQAKSRGLTETVLNGILAD